MSLSPRTHSPRSDYGNTTQGGGTHNHNGSSVARDFGTVLGPGTCGLGPEQTNAADNEIDRRMVRDFWSEWDKTRAEWKRLDADRDAKVVEELSKNSRQKVIEASIRREAEIKAMTAQRKKFEQEAKERKKEEAAQQMKINQEHNELLKKIREDGITRRAEAKARELESIHQERTQMLEMDRIEKEQEQQAQRVHIERLRAWHEHCKEEARKEQEKRLQLAKTSVLEVRAKKDKRKHMVDGWRKDIVASKAALKQNVRTDIDERWAATKRKLEDASRTNYLDLKASLTAQLELKEKRDRDHAAAKQSLVKTLRQRMVENRRAYEDRKAAEKERLQLNVKAQRERAQQEKEMEEIERRREHEDFINNVRELAQRKRIESPKKKRASRSNNANSAAASSPDATAQDGH